LCYHVLNRGNGRNKVFRKDGFHLIIWPRHDGDLSRWMQWLLTSHVRRYHRHYHGSGHVWQGRFKAFPIEQDEHLLAVLRYVERNPLRAGLVERAEEWAWSSLAWRRARGANRLRPAILADWPVACPRNWVSLVNRVEKEADLAAVRRSIARGTPYGSDKWTNRTATRLGLESSLRPRGRPRKYPKK
jgi:putative transposase